MKKSKSNFLEKFYEFLIHYKIHFIPTFLPKKEKAKKLFKPKNGQNLRNA